MQERLKQMVSFKRCSTWNEEKQRMEILCTEQCLVAYHIGLPDLWDIEIQLQDGVHYFLFWDESDSVVRARELTPNEIAFIPESVPHLNKVFSTLRRGLTDLQKVLAKGSGDAAQAARLIREARKTHDRNLNEKRSRSPLVFADPHVRLATLLSERLEDIVEMLAVSNGLLKIAEKSLPSHQRVDDDNEG